MPQSIPKTRLHPETGGILRRGERDMTVEFRGLKRVVKVKGWFPDDGDDGLMWRDDGANADRALAELKAEYAARLRKLARSVAKKVAAVSERKITNKSLSLLLTGSPNSFSKYELGSATPSHPTMILMALLEKRPDLVKDIEAAAETPAA